MAKIEELKKIVVSDKVRYVVPNGTKVLKLSDDEMVDSITSVVIPNSIVSIDNDFFKANRIYEIINHSNVEIEYNYAIITDNDDTCLFECRDFVFMEKDSKWYLIKYIGCDDIIKFPESLMINGTNIGRYEIARNAFRENKLIKKITIPASVVAINEYAFYDCENLEYVEIEGAEYIGSRAFVDCSDNLKIILPDNLKKVGSFITNTFITTIYGGCKYIGNDENPHLLLLEIEDIENECYIHPDCKIIQGEAFSNSKITSIYIPNSVSYISNYAFEFSDVKNIIIESRDTVIGNSAFVGCDEIE